MGRKKTKPKVVLKPVANPNQDNIDWVFDFIFSQVKDDVGGKIKKK